MGSIPVANISYFLCVEVNHLSVGVKLFPNLLIKQIEWSRFITDIVAPRSLYSGYLSDHWLKNCVYKNICYYWLRDNVFVINWILASDFQLSWSSVTNGNYKKLKVEMCTVAQTCATCWWSRKLKRNGWFIKEKMNRGKFERKLVKYKDRCSEI